MSDFDRATDPQDTLRVQQKVGSGQAVTQQEIDDVLNDASLSAAERENRLTDLRQRILDSEHERGDEEYTPLQVRIMDALSMLAEGGHDYTGRHHVEGDSDGASKA